MGSVGVPVLCLQPWFCQPWKKRYVYVGWLIHMFKKEKQIFTEHTLYARSTFKCRRSKMHIYMSKAQSLFSEGPMAQILDRNLFSTCCINKLFWLYVAHVALFYSTWILLSMLNGNRTIAFSLIRLNCNVYIMKFKIKFLFLMLTPAILNTNKQLKNPYWIKWVN